MTIIAYRDGVIAADTLICAGSSRAGHAQKIDSVEGWLIGGAGTIGITGCLRTWVRNSNGDVAIPVDFGKLEDAVGILISPQGLVYFANTTSPRLTMLTAPFHVLGSGSDFAATALLLGKSVPDAVACAIQLETTCGGGIQWISRDGSSQLDLPKEIYNFVNSS